ncbi:hypothetical protein BDV34DRAFT_186275 [Aspergillus parasiticus]|uniref:Uncharacterized protein n=1 Tax=Aspergillus parasiticus TaxID=5067 RepID=A0A5N6E1Q4_ASPPA|nr:hypothetical protein BDV34DRAFT_186275 [Aspergillus parasiticus]
MFGLCSVMFCYTPWRYVRYGFASRLGWCLGYILIFWIDGYVWRCAYRGRRGALT